MGATTSKGHHVLNVMAYKRRDAMRYVLREYDSIRRLVQVVDMQMPVIITNIGTKWKSKIIISEQESKIK